MVAWLGLSLLLARLAVAAWGPPSSPCKALKGDAWGTNVKAGHKPPRRSVQELVRRSESEGLCAA